MADGYTPDDVELATLTPAYDAACEAVKAAGYPMTIEQANALLIGTRAALSALAAAGRLLPEGTETAELWGTRLTWDTGEVEDPEVPATRERAQYRVDWHTRKRAEVPEHRITAAVLVRSYQHITPWEPAEGGQP